MLFKRPVGFVLLQKRFFASLPSTMSAWQIHSYDSDFVLNQGISLPKIEKPDDILIEIKAASINPIDVRMKIGYGGTLFGVVWQLQSRSLSSISTFPLTLGRDCSGIVKAVGQNVRKFRPGDEVYCAPAVSRNGCFAEYVISSEGATARKPSNLDHIQAASFPYVVGTSWSALCTSARLNPKNCPNSTVLVHGGTGGIGTFSIQLLKAWGAKVVTTCSAGSFDTAKSLGAIPVDYNAVDAYEQLLQLGPYDVILDTANTDLAHRSIELLGVWRHCVYATITNPMMNNFDQNGFGLGAVHNILDFGRKAAEPLTNGRWYKWCFFKPNGDALSTVTDLIEQGKMKPVLQKVLNFAELPKAFELLSQKHAKGKIVVEFSDTTDKNKLSDKDSSKL